MSLRGKLKRTFEDHLNGAIPISVGSVCNVTREYAAAGRSFDIVYQFFSDKGVDAKVNFRYNHHSRRIDIFKMNVRDDIQGRGYGTRFVQAIESAARKLKVNNIVAKDSKANGFWNSLGYKRILDWRILILNINDWRKIL